MPSYRKGWLAIRGQNATANRIQCKVETEGLTERNRENNIIRKGEIRQQPQLLKTPNSGSPVWQSKDKKFEGTLQGTHRTCKPKGSEKRYIVSTITGSLV